jgi:hypothetical protein
MKGSELFDELSTCQLQLSAFLLDVRAAAKTTGAAGGTPSQYLD